MSESAIQIKVKLFAIYQETFGESELELTFDRPIAISKVLENLIAKKPQLEQWQEVTRFGVNLQFVSGDTLLKDGDEVVFIPPVSGG